MHPPIRSQALAGMGNEDASAAAALSFVNAKDTARQEFKLDADINTILTRFGVQQQTRRITFGEVDFGLDLQQALSAVDQASKAYRTLPKELRAEFPTWQSVLNALVAGTLNVRLEEARAEREASPPAPPTPPA